ncbi:MAG TPA: ion transporter [Candidatus Paceibacterota bacterium]|nr:ion transporter [Candidatus Paceibacterota bacterium]HMO82867.1 ion transporter [Candidatus Paceibacterota bacterium]
MTAKSNFVTRIQNNPWYALSLMLLAFSGLGLLAYEYTPFAQPEVVRVTMRLDLAIAYIFLLDFLVGLFFNQKYTYQEYWRQNWLDFISSIPISAEMARALRILRVFRALRVISSALDVYFTRRRYRLLKK